MTCQVCFDDDCTLIDCCGEGYEPTLCQNCFCEHFRVTLQDAYMGSCPILTCPVHRNSNGKAKELNYWRWEAIMEPSDNVERYKKLVDSVVAFRCSSCHGLHSLIEFKEQYVSRYNLHVCYDC